MQKNVSFRIHQISNGASNRVRTGIFAMARRHNSHYTIPALDFYIYIISNYIYIFKKYAKVSNHFFIYDIIILGDINE